MSKKILLCVTGLSPQVVTETLYALAVKPRQTDTRWIPDEIHVLTTSEGANRIRLSLLHPATGWFNRIRQEYHLPAIQFDNQNLHILHNKKDQPMQDIRTEQDNRVAADTITATIREMTADPETQLHVSIAGGRKTMGFYAGYALSLFGRRQDRLSHVLVNAPFESHPEFYYPTRESRVIYMQGVDSKPIDTQEAIITLADIPFVRMQEGIHERFDEKAMSFSHAVASIQNDLSKIMLTLQPDQCLIQINDENLTLNANEYAFYWWLVEDCKQGGQGKHWSEQDIHQQFLDYYKRLLGPHNGNYNRTVKALQKGMDKDYFESKKAKINQKLAQQFGKHQAQPYQIVRKQKIPGCNYSRFGPALKPLQIEIL